MDLVLEPSLLFFQEVFFQGVSMPKMFNSLYGSFFFLAPAKPIPQETNGTGLGSRKLPGAHLGKPHQ